MSFKAAVVAGNDSDVSLFQKGGGKADGIGDPGPAGGFAKRAADVGEAVETPWGLTQTTPGAGLRRSHMCRPRSSNSFRIVSTLSAPRGSVSAKAAGNCVKLVMWLVICDCSLLIASMAGLGPPMYPMRQPVIAKLLLWQLKVSVRSSKAGWSVAKLTNFSPS